MPTVKGECGRDKAAICNRWFGRAVGDRRINVLASDIPNASARTCWWSGMRVAVRKIFRTGA